MAMTVPTTCWSACGNGGSTGSSATGVTASTGSSERWGGPATNPSSSRRHEEMAAFMACAERVLLPAVREDSPATVVVADGFSCRTQISQGTDCRALHTAGILAMALHRE